MKCDNCTHKEVCGKKPPKSYPRFMIDIMTNNCEHYVHADLTPKYKPPMPPIIKPPMPPIIKPQRKHIKTIWIYYTKANEFDKEVNAAISDGWELEDAGITDSNMLYAFMLRYEEQERKE